MGCGPHSCELRRLRRRARTHLIRPAWGAAQPPAVDVCLAVVLLAVVALVVQDKP
jgi:hypothetical protein